MGVQFMSLKGKASNPLIQNMKLREFLGWFAAAIFPFASKGISETTGGGVIAALVYFAVCGWLLRTLSDGGMPFFSPKLKASVRQLIRLVSVFAIFAAFVLTEFKFKTYPMVDAVLLVTLFAIPKGVFEPLVAVNVYELAGARIKLSGYAAGIVSSMMMYLLYWDRFISVSVLNVVILIFFQSTMNLFAINIYRKTKDLTVCSILQIIFNLAVLFLCGFESMPYLAA
jgi:hypothetical protein